MEAKRGSAQQIRLGAILSYVSIALNFLAGLFYTPWMVQIIGEGSYGLYTLANSLITLFTVDFGLSAATARYLSKYHAEGEEAKANRLLGAVYRLYLIVDAVIFLVLSVVFLFIDRIYVKLTPAELEQFRVVYLIAAASCLFSMPFVTQNGILTAYEKFIQLKLADVLQRILTVGLIVWALLCGKGLYALVIIHALVGVAVVAYKFVVIRVSTPVRADFSRPEKGIYREVLGFSFWAMVTSLAARLIFTVSPSILGITAGSADIAVFGIVTQIEGYAYTLTTAINGMFMPRIARIYTDGKEESELMPLMLKVGRFQFAIGGLILVGFASVGQSFLSLWLKDAVYAPAYAGILLVILPGIFFNSLQIANTAMLVKKKVHIPAVISVIIGVVNIALSFPLSSRFGALGACISIMVAYTLRVVLFSAASHRVLGLDMWLFTRKCFLRLLPVLILSFCAGWSLDRLLPTGGWLWFGIRAVLIGLIYGVLTLLIGLTREERRALLKRILK